MKRLTAIAIVLVMLCTLLVSCKKDTTVPDGMKLASGDSATYYLYIPEDWVVDLSTAATSAHVSNSDKSNISVMAWSLPNTDDTVDTWHEAAVEEYKITFTDYEEVSATEATVSGVFAKDYVYTAKLGGEERQYRQVAAVKSGIVYVITYSTTPELFDDYLDEVDSIISEFIIK